jgi:hypothetical protein
MPFDRQLRDILGKARQMFITLQIDTPCIILSSRKEGQFYALAEPTNVWMCHGIALRCDFRGFAELRLEDKKAWQSALSRPVGKQR